MYEKILFPAEIKSNAPVELVGGQSRSQDGYFHEEFDITCSLCKPLGQSVRLRPRSGTRTKFSRVVPDFLDVKSVHRMHQDDID